MWGEWVGGEGVIMGSGWRWERVRRWFEFLPGTCLLNRKGKQLWREADNPGTCENNVSEVTNARKKSVYIGDSV